MAGCRCSTGASLARQLGSAGFPGHPCQRTRSFAAAAICAPPVPVPHGGLPANHRASADHGSAVVAMWGTGSEPRSGGVRVRLCDRAEDPHRWLPMVGFPSRGCRYDAKSTWSGFLFAGRRCGGEATSSPLLPRPLEGIITDLDVRSGGHSRGYGVSGISWELDRNSHMRCYSGCCVRSPRRVFSSERPARTILPWWRRSSPAESP
jgi:hypothetical protein